MAQLTIKLVNTLRARANGGPLLPAGLALNVNFPNAPTAATPFAFSRHGTMPPPTAAVSLRSPTRTTRPPQSTAATRTLAGGLRLARRPPASVTLLRHDAVPAAAIEPGTVAGSFTAALPAGGSAVFSVTAEGKIVAGASACQLSGSVAAHAMPNTLALKLSTSACSGLPASATGVLAVDSDYAPAAFRLLADDGSRVVDLWAYRD